MIFFMMMLWFHFIPYSYSIVREYLLSVRFYVLILRKSLENHLLVNKFIILFGLLSFLDNSLVSV